MSGFDYHKYYQRNDFLLYGLITGLFALVFGVLAYSTVWSYPWQSNWDKVNGTIISNRAGFRQCFVTYSYSFKEIKYEQSEVFKVFGSTLKPGDRVAVRVEPTNPNHAKIESGFNLATVLYLIAATMSGLIALGFINGFMSWKTGSQNVIE